VLHTSAETGCRRVGELLVGPGLHDWSGPLPSDSFKPSHSAVFECGVSFPMRLLELDAEYAGATVWL